MSRSVSKPTQWATLDGGITSDGSPSFIQASRIEQKIMKNNYVGGAYGNGRTARTGFFHFETIEANKLLLFRIETYHMDIKDRLIYNTWCCGSKPVINEDSEIVALLSVCIKVLKERIAAPIPYGILKTNKIGNAETYTTDGIWLYPPIVVKFCDGKVTESRGQHTGSMVQSSDFKINISDYK